jgi:tRNA pseudouridine55 synthase
VNAAFLVMDKVPGLTSHDVVAIVRAVTGIKKVGHTGTLDPFASGVLVLALGGATRFIQYLDESLKVYDATIALGAATTTGDPEGPVNRTGPEADFTLLDSVLAGFQGEQMQTPPAYSAVKVKGKALYKYARKGIKVEAKPRPVTIYRLTAPDRGADWLRIRLHCSRGTYARVLADDIGSALGTAGHLRQLRRLQSGPFMLNQALTLPSLAQLVAGTSDWRRALRPGRGDERMPWRPRGAVLRELLPWCIPLDRALSHLPMVEVGDQHREPFLRGGHPPTPPADLAEGARYGAVDRGEFLGIVERQGKRGVTLRAVKAAPAQGG